MRKKRLFFLIFVFVFLSEGVLLCKSPVEVKLEQAERLRCLRECDKAEKLYREVLDVDKDNIEALYFLGCIFNSKGKFAQAVKCYEKILEIDPGHVDAKFGMSKAYFAMPSFQDIVINNVPGCHGECLCDCRYEVIKKLIKKHDGPALVLDIGASEGYFPFRLAQNFKESTFFMIEPKHDLFNLCKLNSDLKNIVLVEKAATINDLIEVGKRVHFDFVLCLCVVQVFDDQWKEAVDTILSLGDNVIIELPPVGAKIEAGQKHLGQMNEYLLSKGQVIARTPRAAWGGTDSVAYLIKK